MLDWVREVVRPLGRAGAQPVGRGWRIWMKGAGREGQDSREGFPLGRTAVPLPTRTKRVPDPIPALSVAPERGGGWSCWVSLCQPGAEINALSRSLGFREQGRAGSDPAPVKDPASGETLSWISLEHRPLLPTPTTHTHTISVYQLGRTPSSEDLGQALPAPGKGEAPPVPPTHPPGLQTPPSSHYSFILRRALPCTNPADTVP